MDLQQPSDVPSIGAHRHNPPYVYEWFDECGICEKIEFANDVLDALGRAITISMTTNTSVFTYYSSVTSTITSSPR